ncbi:PAS domain S-box-containing protein [Duganella sp. 1411]|uniref:ATP-binding protein n=1 Tax=Duganella sp. 1411 TaxID=2806572 RepID=UPI001AE24057|nr:ATP-binding protein [Duganella sp. 1411]MBP1204850.1 PAS domain S-box-containing protein [Duganella sp. 1411]
MMQPFSSDQPHTILIATSAAYDHVALGKTLGRYGYAVRAVSRGDEALTIAAGGGVATTVLDAALAGSAGLELCQRLQRLCGADVPIYVLSNAPSEEERARATELGAAAYLPLTFNADDLAEDILLRLQAIPAAPAEADLPSMATLEVNYHTMLSGSPDAILLLQRGSHRVLDVNRRARELFGLTGTELMQRQFPSLCPPLQPDGRPSPQVFGEHVDQVLAGGVQVYELTMWHSSGRTLCCELRMVPLDSGRHRLMHVRVVDITRRKLAEALRDGKNRLLEMIARAAPLGDILERLMLLIESQSEDVLCTALLLAPDGVHVQVGAGPSLPPDYLATIDGQPIGPAAGSCGTAMHRRQTVVVADIMNDPLWRDYRETAARYGLRACWSMPIMLDGDTVLGSFAMYYREVRTPSDEDLSLIGAATHIAGIAIVRTRREEELRRHREHLEELVAARTGQLLQAKEEAEHVNEELSTALGNLSMTQEELVRRDKLAALGALVAGVAHELNTPIGNSLVMASSMSERTAALRRDMENGLRRSTLESYVREAASADEVVVRNLRRAAALVASFRHIAVDSASSQRVRFVLGDPVAQLLQPLEADLRQRGLTLEEDVDHLLEMDSYPGPLSQALGHLIDNSVVHGFDGRAAGTIALSARDGGNGEVIIEVADTGAGIPAANLPRIYDPFFTTRLGSGGSGLGLYITHNIVTGVLGGRIDVVSTEGEGARFTLRLPKVAPL